MKKLSIVVRTAILLGATFVAADTLTLNDGTTLEGSVVSQGDRYWIKITSTGESRFIPKAEVKSWSRQKASDSAGAKSSAPANPAASPGFQETKGRAERVDAPLVAVGLWQSFIDANPDSADLAAAKTDLEHWKTLDAQHAEKINGKWIGGKERKELIQKVAKLLREADEEQRSNQTVKTVQTLEEAVRIYPI